MRSKGKQIQKRVLLTKTRTRTRTFLKLMTLCDFGDKFFVSPTKSIHLEEMNSSNCSEMVNGHFKFIFGNVYIQKQGNKILFLHATRWTPHLSTGYNSILNDFNN